MLNKVLIIGNLGDKPKLTSGAANFSVATSENWTDKNGEKKVRTEWCNVVCFGKQAENCEKYLDKGSKVLVEGKLRTDSYEKDGIKRYITKINALNVQFLDSKPKKETNHQQDFTADNIPF